jgi:hypothetical protein
MHEAAGNWSGLTSIASTTANRIDALFRITQKTSTGTREIEPIFRQCRGLFVAETHARRISSGVPAKPSALVDPRVIYSGDNLDQRELSRFTD